MYESELWKKYINDWVGSSWVINPLKNTMSDDLSFKNLAWKKMMKKMFMKKKEGGWINRRIECLLKDLEWQAFPQVCSISWRNTGGSPEGRNSI